MVRRVVNRASWFFIIITMLSLVIIILLTTVNVSKRYIIGSDIVAVIQINEFLLVAVTFLGLAWTQLKRGHVATEFLFTRLSKRGQQSIEMFISIVCLFLAVLLCWASWLMAVDGYELKETIYAAGTIIPMWQIRFVIPLGVALYILTLLFDFKDSLVELIRGGKK